MGTRFARAPDRTVTPSRDGRGRLRARWLLALVLPIALGGCFVASWSPDRTPAETVSGPAVYVENCATCHGDGVVKPYSASAHSARGIRCGQCHAGGQHPDFTQPVRDGTCAGCHQPEFQQTIASKHFATRVPLALDGDRGARTALRRARFVATAGAERKFAGDRASGEPGGRLCAACHYDEHRFSLAAVQRAELCAGCHGDRAQHFPDAATGNRCVSCHVRSGETATGQAVNSHRFAIPGTEGTGK